MTCSAVRHPEPPSLYRVTWRGPWGTRLDLVVPASDASAAVVQGIQRLAAAVGEPEQAAWSWIRTERIG